MDIYYLVHVTDRYNCNWNELVPSPMSEYQFPGVYFTLITKENIKKYILSDNPLHPAFDYLSETHNADYLRTYFINSYLRINYFSQHLEDYL